jgi:hypothetical protein
MIDKRLDTLKDLGYQAFTGIGHTLPHMPGLDLLEIAQCRLSKPDFPRSDPAP